MENDILKHRKAVQENILKSFGVEVSEDMLEKAHNPGDIHPNGKWVWTKTPSGYDWRTIKGAGKAAPAANSKTDTNVGAAANADTTSKNKGNAKSTSDFDSLSSAKTQLEVNKFWENLLTSNSGKGKNLAGKLLDSMKEYGYNNVSGAMTTSGINTFKFANKDADMNITMVPYQDGLVIKTNDKKEILKVSDFKTISDFKKKFDETVLKLSGNKKSDDKKSANPLGFKVGDTAIWDEKANKVTLHTKVLIVDLNEKTDTAKIKAPKDRGTFTVSISALKLPKKKNSDGSYTLEANGKKVKSDDADVVEDNKDSDVKFNKELFDKLQSVIPKNKRLEIFSAHKIKLGGDLKSLDAFAVIMETDRGSYKASTIYFDKNGVGNYSRGDESSAYETEREAMNYAETGRSNARLKDKSKQYNDWHYVSDSNKKTDKDDKKKIDSDFIKGTKKQFEDIYNKIKGKTVNLGVHGSGVVVGMEVRSDGYTEACIRPKGESSILTAGIVSVLNDKIEDLFSGGSTGLNIDKKAIQ